MSAQSDFIRDHSFLGNVWRNRLGRPRSPKDVEAAGFEPTDEQRRVYRDYIDEVIERYRNQTANMTPEAEAEQQFEISANFEPGTTVVDVITGRKWTS